MWYVAYWTSANRGVYRIKKKITHNIGSVHVKHYNGRHYVLKSAYLTVFLFTSRNSDWQVAPLKYDQSRCVYHVGHCSENLPNLWLTKFANLEPVLAGINSNAGFYCVVQSTHVAAAEEPLFTGRTDSKAVMHNSAIYMLIQTMIQPFTGILAVCWFSLGTTRHSLLSIPLLSRLPRIKSPLVQTAGRHVVPDGKCD